MRDERKVVFVTDDTLKVRWKVKSHIGKTLISLSISIWRDDGLLCYLSLIHICTAKEAEYTMQMNRKAAKYFSILYPLIYWKIKRQESVEGYYEEKDPEMYRQVQKNKVLFGACLIFTPSFVLKEEKAFWPETRFFYEEYILAKRCQNKGYETIYEPAVHVIHESGAATKLSSRTARNRIRFQVERIAEDVYKRQ